MRNICRACQCHFDYYSTSEDARCNELPNPYSCDGTEQSIGTVQVYVGSDGNTPGTSRIRGLKNVFHTHESPTQDQADNIFCGMK